MIGVFSNRKTEWLKRWSELDLVLIVSSLFSIGLVLFRIVYTRHYLFLGMVWNLFLAFIPFALSRWMYKNVRFHSRLAFFISLGIWLLFIPNAFYIITDLFHLKQNPNCPLWYDLALLFSFAWNGLLLGIISVNQMEKMFTSIFNKSYQLLFIVPVMFLNSFGVYIGRFLRYNSWDIISNPVILAKDIIYLIIHPLRNKVDWGMITCYAILMTLIYLSLKKLSKEIS
jgi:Predicted membrane protein